MSLLFKSVILDKTIKAQIMNELVNNKTLIATNTILALRFLFIKYFYAQKKLDSLWSKFCYKYLSFRSIVLNQNSLFLNNEN